MADTIYRLGHVYAYKCPGCGSIGGGYGSEHDAKLALRLHQIGCKKS